MDEKREESWMKEALLEAQRAKALGEVPVGALIVSPQGELLSRAHNLKESQNDPTGHAEILAIKGAAQKLKSWRLTDLTLYVTLEPCMMCTGTLIQSRIGKVVFGAHDPKGGFVESLTKGLELQGLNHRVKYQGGVLAKECGQILKDFFNEKRQQRN